MCLFSMLDCIILIYLFFFFSSRRRHTRCLSDWSSDVCSSDLAQVLPFLGQLEGGGEPGPDELALHLVVGKLLGLVEGTRAGPRGFRGAGRLAAGVRPRLVV